MKNTSWRVIISDISDPPTNLAMEEALLRSRIERNAPNTLRIWQNQPCVIIGRSQNVNQEVNIRYCQSIGIPIFRRCSGGGAVYQDLGNYNYSIIMHRGELSKLKGTMSSFEFICKGVMMAIESVGGSPEFFPPSNIFVQGGKVSGSSQYLLYNGLLQHGTLLVSADLKKLNLTLDCPISKKTSKTVVSNLVPVKNLNESLRKRLTTFQIQNCLIDSFSRLFGHPFQFGTLSKWEKQMTRRLVNLKYADPSWVKNGFKWQRGQ